MTDESQATWEQFRAMVDACRTRVLDSRWARTGTDRAQALYYIQMLQAFGFNLYMAPRQAYPNFYTKTIFLPFEYGFGAPCPDFYYQWTFLDGARTYRLWGRLGDTRWTEFQAQRGFWGDDDQRRLGNWDFDDFEIGPDGTFEIVASPDRHVGNWIELDPTAPNIVLMVRDAVYDWAGERNLEIHIEATDRDGSEPVAHDEAGMNRRLAAIGRLTRNAVEFFLRSNEEALETVGLNQFFAEPLRKADDVGGNPRARYMKMLYDIGPDEALVIETAVPKARYWSVHLADHWWQTIDYAHHHSSLNGGQVRLDADGKARLVLSKQDPGVPNWLDPVDNLAGVALWRWYLAAEDAVPTVARVPVAEVRRHLPADTPVVDAAARAAIVDHRRRAVLARYGF